MSVIGNKIKTLRTDRGLTLDGLASLIYGSKSYIWDIENGNTPRPSADKVFLLSKALHVPMEYLINDDYQVEPVLEKEALFSKYSFLDDSKKKMIHELIDVWLNEKRTVVKSEA